MEAPMKYLFHVFLFVVVCAFFTSAQVLQLDDSSVKPENFIVPQGNIVPGSGGDFGNLLTTGVLVTNFPDYSGNLHPMGIAFDGTNYYVVGGGNSPGDVAQLDASFNLVATQSVALDCRSVFYNPADGDIYIKAFTNNGLYRLHTSPFDGGYDVIFTSIFQDAQSKVCISPDGTKLYDHLNGTVHVYDFASGTLLNTITLNLQHDLTWPRGNLIAHTGTYLLTYAHPMVYAYDPTDGSFVSACDISSQPNANEWSMSYTNGMFISANSAEDTWYAWTIDEGVPVELTSFTANVVNNNVNLNWATATETNNQGFEIQRKSDNTEFEQVGYVAGFGTTTEPKSYSFSDANVSAGNYTYRLKQMDFDGSFEYSDEVNVEVLTPGSFELSQNYPNPFNPSTTIKYSLPENSFVNLAVYNLLGENVRTLVNEVQNAGNYNLNFDASGLTSGTYVYRLSTASGTLTQKMVLLK